MSTECNGKSDWKNTFSSVSKLNSMCNDEHDEVIGICFVVVLYRCSEAESVACASLKRLFEKLSIDGATKFILTLWDNTPFTSDCETSELTWPAFVEVTRVQRPDNPGLVAAYNHAWKIAGDRRAHWLVTLDQDTDLPFNFLEETLTAMRQTKGGEVAALAPILTDGKKHVSPVGYSFGWPNPWKIVDKPGMSDSRLLAINSGLAIRISFLEHIGGYDPEYKVDYIDHWLCREIFRRRLKIKVLDIHLRHELSVNSFLERVSLFRYASILRAQRAFLLSDENWSTWLVANITMPLHAFRILFRTKDRRFFRLAFHEWIEFVRGKP